MRDRERIGRGPGRYQENRHLMLEQLGKALLEAPRHRVIAVGERGAPIRSRNRGQNLRCHSDRIVACKVHRLSPALPRRSGSPPKKSPPSANLELCLLLSLRLEFAMVD
jgi:hypothetical protein